MLPQPALAQEPWDAPAFTADPAAMLRAASAFPVARDVDVVILFRDDRFYLEADGRSTYTRRMVYRLVTPAGAEGWSAVASEYSPWYEERPSIRARVITSDGAAHSLDPATLGEGPAQEDSDQVYTDRRVLRGPLPAVAPGAVVEEEIVVRETAPLLAAGSVHQAYFSSSVPRRRSRLEISYPASLPLLHSAQLLPSLEVTRTEKDGRIVLVMEAGPMDPVEPAEPFLPGDVAAWPRVQFSTAQSWQHVAEAYGRLVDAQLAGADLSRVVAPLLKGKKSRPEVVAAVLSRLHQDVRYTGVEYAEAAIIPRSPRETLERRYGDCKDKAALLIALLRQAGVPAYFALLSTGSGQDVSPDLPGMGVFNHAIVYAPGSPDFWIDATAEDWRLGDLPPADQGRLALVIAPGTRELLRTPAAASTANRFVETREFLLAETGPAKVTETTETFGSVEGFFRSAYGEGSDDSRKQLEQYVKSAYLAESLDKLEHSAARDFSQPFRLRLEAGKAARGQTSDVDAAVRVSTWPLVNRLPSLILSEEEEQKQSAGQTKKQRRNDLELLEPYSAEIRARVVPPPGFRPLSVPENSVNEMGPARLRQEFTTDKNGVVTAVLSFDTVKRRFSPDELEALKTKVRALGKEEMLLISFEQVGRSHLAAGRVKEALAEFQALSALHPKEALHRSQVAEALLEAGIGDASRREARRAIELEPSSAAAHRTLAWILQHDLVGRRLEKGWDPQGSEAAYRKAIELDKDDNLSRANLAILLEFNSYGDRYGPGARLADAIKEYEAMKDKLASVGVEDNLPVVLFRAERFAQLRELLKTMPSTQQRMALTVAAIAATEGAQPALLEARKLSTNDRSRNAVLVDAGELLIKIRRYAPTAELLTAGAPTADNPGAVLARADSFRRAQRYEEIKLPEDDPRTVVRRFFIEFYSQPLTENIFRLFSRHAATASNREEELQQLRRGVRGLRATFAREQTPMSVLSDVVLSVMEMSAEGNDQTGFRIRTQSPGSDSRVFHVVREDGQYRILGDHAAAGALVLEALAQGKLDLARQWLDWLREDMRAGGGEDPLSGPLLPRFWERGQAPEPAAMRSAAAALLAGSEKSDKAVPLLEEGRRAATTDDQRTAFDLALARAYTKLENPAALLPVAERLLAGAPKSQAAFALVSQALLRLERWSDAERLPQERLQLLPDDEDALRALARIAAHQGQFAKAGEHHARLEAVGKAESADYNSLAWWALVAGAVTPQAIEAAERGTALSSNQNGAVIHTLACLYAEVGRTKDARDRLLHLMEVWGLDEPDSATWYGFGRIAEQFGMRDAAVDAYRRVEAPKRKFAIDSSTWSLAQRRLKLLGSATEKPAVAK